MMMGRYCCCLDFLVATLWSDDTSFLFCVTRHRVLLLIACPSLQWHLTVGVGRGWKGRPKLLGCSFCCSPTKNPLVSSPLLSISTILEQRLQIDHNDIQLDFRILPPGMETSIPGLYHTVSVFIF